MTSTTHNARPHSSPAAGTGADKRSVPVATTKRDLSPLVLRHDLEEDCEDIAAITRMVARSLRRLGIVPNHVEHGLSIDRRKVAA